MEHPGYENEEKLIVKDLGNTDIDLVVLSDTKMNGTGSKQLGDYIHFFSGVPKSERAKILEKDSYGNEVSRIARPLPVEYLLVDVPASTPVNPQYTFNSDPSKEPFPIENRLIETQLQDFNALSQYLSQFGPQDFYTAITDFHLLLYISTMDMLPMRDYMGPLLEAIRTKNLELAEEWSRSEHWATVEQLIAASSPPPSRPGSVAAGGVSVGIGGASSSGPKWTCSFCTFLNSMNLNECEMCSSPRLTNN
ncbi:hypothetical protein HHI36_015690 [Cryptolaemus montrouzieri]|uniref:RanBP2-type domain-containing protein n=1 Tax=Cryptolaemus montrouzieri TaxID=559131 RepID=A0ABD2N6F1_9CUCU